MADKELRTSLVLEAKTKGFENAQKRAEKLRDALSAPTVAGAFGKLDKNLVAVEKAFAKITVHLEKMDRAMRKFEKSIDVLSRRMRQVGAPVGVGAPGAPAPAPIGPLGPLGGGAPGGPTGAAPPVSNPSIPGTGTAPPAGPYSTRGLYFSRRELGPSLPPGWHRNRYTGGAQRDMSPWLQGIFQGAGFGEYIPRDQGIRPMLQQAGGRFIGAAGRRAAHGVLAFAGSPFTGLEGISTGLAAIPGGGIVAGQLNTAMSNAQAALGVQRAEFGLAPYLPTGASAAGAIAAAREAEMSRFDINRIYPEYAGTPKAAIAQTPEDREIRSAVEGTKGISKFTGKSGYLAGKRMRKLPQQSEPGMSPLEGRLEETEIRRETRELTDRRAALGKLASAAAKKAGEVALDRALGFSALESDAKTLMGVGRPEALAYAGSFLHASGGTLAGAQSNGMLSAAMAAKTAYGLEAGTAGVFQRAAREGGVVGGGRGGDMLARLIGDAQRGGREGSEITEYLEEMASAMTEFRTTGIPVNSQSISQLGVTMATSGLGIMRGNAVAQQLAGTAQRISTGGPTNAAEFQLLQTVGEFQGGGMEELETALEKLQTGDYKGAGFREFVRRALAAGGGGANGREALRRAMRTLNAPINVAESKVLERFSTGTMTGDDQKYMDEVAARLEEGSKAAPGDAIALSQRAQGYLKDIGGSLARQAELDNERIRLGKSFVTSLQMLDGSTQNVQRSFEQFAPEITKLVGFIGSISETFPGLVEKFRKVAGFGEAVVGTSGTTSATVAGGK
jgi:hypothetical protein